MLLRPKSLYTTIVFAITSTYSQANQVPNLPELNRLDASQQQRQTLHQQAQHAQLQHQAEVRLETSHQQLSLSNNESPCYPIHNISLIDYDSNTQKSQFQWALDKAVRDLKLTLPHCFGGEGLGILMKQVQNNIIEKGYVTTRVVTEEQDLRGGKLVLTVIIGKVRNTIVADSGNTPRFTKLNALTAFTFAKGDILNVRDIEQSLENLKRVPTVEANIEILPSDDETASVDESDLKISYAQAFPFRLNVGLDDSGSKSTGKWQGSATLSVDNLLSANDLFYASFTHSIKQKGDDKGKRASKNLTLYYAIPFGYWNLAFSHNQSRYHQEVFGAFENSYIYAGESANDKLTLSYLLYRDSVRKTTISASAWSRQSQNYIDGAEIDVQKRRMAGWDAGFSHKEYWGNSTLEFSANYKRGTGARGQLQAPEELWGEGTSRPQIISASMSFNKPFMWGSQPWQFNSSWNAQWNKTPLIPQDRLSIGGRYTVRGFDGELTLSGERGWLWRNELAWNLNGLGQQIYFALDGGRVTGWATKNQLGHHLMGTALGLRGYFKGISYDVFGGRPIRKPEGFKTSDAVAGFNLNYHF
ncbi:Hemolysin activation/secretion protein [Bibersteinia trehalosi USDA-ARS-USMARC-189]|uniref:Hemolysin activation/secretion protein n=1 Tax=Bibersteinia trehalosi USDA-ARS-USMARC-189 TaxID=1263831 RepID=A0ABM5PD80_BIBTR|nr:ShlB/FhaC/HecB family hemolysin secretion/activation protein [Bibersteinia trehalosi]AGH38477.1 Hemolysin activation/secretion protein [Bibersteinia trehalosi USDA-ARS-USMARC-192]AHG84008.1 Hemolysin activation/secretion protein [Bibersteinia trehalosi USDA-ARS-USMARC-189]